jgi:hypothetical protein
MKQDNGFKFFDKDNIFKCVEPLEWEHLNIIKEVYRPITNEKEAEIIKISNDDFIIDFSEEWGL